MEDKDIINKRLDQIEQQQSLILTVLADILQATREFTSEMEKLLEGGDASSES